MSRIIKVGMAELDICKSPDGISTLGLGSCVGVVIRDPNMKIGGIVHVMLPDSTKIRNSENMAKFADTGIDALIKKMVNAGANRNNLVAKIAGGAQMFNFQNKLAVIRVGDRNIEACKAILKEKKIPILAEDTGKNYGRTVIFYPENGKFVIRAVGKEETCI
jgi:chemotaxis protein CheD